MSIPSTALPLLTGGALSAIFGMFSLAGLWRSWRMKETDLWWQATHGRVLFLTVLAWSGWKVIDAVISTTARTSWYQMGALSLAGTIGHGTVFMLCYSAYLAFWADVHIHGHLKSHEYRYSRAPWVIFYGAALVTVSCGAIAQFVNLIFVLPPYLTLEVWTVIMCLLMIIGTIAIGVALWKRYPPEDRRAKRISVHMQLVVLVFLSICFLLRARIIWIPSGSTSASMYLQLSRFVFQASEWLAIGVMLIFTFPRRTAGQMVLPSSEVVRVQWKRTRIAMGIAATVALCTTVANATLAIIEPSRTRAPTINNTQHLIFKIIDGTGAGLSALTMLAAGALFLMTFWKRKSSIRPLVLLLVSIASVSGCFCFAVVMSLVIAVYPFDNVTKTLIATSGSSTVNMLVAFIACQIGYRLSNYVKDFNSIDILVDSLDMDENYEKPNKELDNKASTIRRFLLFTLFLHSGWLALYFVPSTEEALVSTLSWGWVVPLVTVIFVIARLPLALFGYISSLVYRRDTTQLRAFVIAQATLNTFGLGILGLQTAFWICHGGKCDSPKSLTSAERFSFMISSLLLLLLIYEGVINLLYFLWYKKIRQQLSTLILEDINQQADAAFA